VIRVALSGALLAGSGDLAAGSRASLAISAALLATSAAIAILGRFEALMRLNRRVVSFAVAGRSTRGTAQYRSSASSTAS
jgi:hypothetical protein